MTRSTSPCSMVVKTGLSTEVLTSPVEEIGVKKK